MLTQKSKTSKGHGYLTTILRSWEAGKIDFDLRYHTITNKHMLRNNFIP